MSKAAIGIGIVIAFITTWVQATLATDIMRSNAEAVREMRQLKDEIQETRETMLADRRKPL